MPLAAPASPRAAHAMLRELQTEALGKVAPSLFVLAFALLCLARRMAQPLAGGLAGLFLLLCPVAIWELNPRCYRASAWLLVLAATLPALTLVGWEGVPGAWTLLVLLAAVALVQLRKLDGILEALA